jgi:aspartate carbamoyltransferase catalytic subunit
VLRGKIVATLFYEPSTRTRFSFESATYRLGGEVITTENAQEFSSATKGETIEDSIRVMSAYADFIVMRHFEEDSSKRAISTAKVPVINAGSGKSQHPTQALLDVYTIWKELGTLEDIHVAVVGDLLRGRTCDSLVYLLSKFGGTHFSFVSPENCNVKESLKEHLEEEGSTYEEIDDMNVCIEKVDALYMTRIQKERFHNTEEYEAAKGKFILGESDANKMKDDAIIMHPLPRVDEISVNVDVNKRARYFEQAENGLWVRMALLVLLNKNK